MLTYESILRVMNLRNAYGEKVLWDNERVPEELFYEGSVSKSNEGEEVIDLGPQLESLKKQLNEITLRINNIRGVISSL